MNPLTRIAGPILVTVLLVLLSAGFALALQITGLKQPASFIVDPATGAYYITNVNGTPTDRDNNGFITKLDGSGKVVKLNFIQGGLDGITLHAPKGLTIVGKTLYVTDIDRVRSFDAASGRPLAEVDLSAFTIDFLTGLATDGHGLLYIADTGTDTIFKADLRHPGKPTVLVKDAVLAGPHGLAVHPLTGALIAVSWNTGKIMEVTPTGAVRVLFANSFFNARFGNLMGVDFDAYGNMYVSDFSQGKVVRIDPTFHIQTIAEFLTTPASLAIDRKNHLILVPYLAVNADEINGLGRERKRK
jgi:DNA-binding beta-propeller fold protein YncE